MSRIDAPVATTEMVANYIGRDGGYKELVY